MSPLDQGPTGRSYWRSLEDLEGDPQFRELVHREFAHLLPDDLPAESRRQFLKIMGASIALAGASGCGNPTWPRW